MIMLMKMTINDHVDDDDDNNQERGRDGKDWEKLVWVSEALHREGAEQLLTCSHVDHHDDDVDQVPDAL